eukprot:SAG31_NODE_17_length_35773_cov_25.999271_19_plen_171_part_00
MNIEMTKCGCTNKEPLLGGGVREADVSGGLGLTAWRLSVLSSSSCFSRGSAACAAGASTTAAGLPPGSTKCFVLPAAATVGPYFSDPPSLIMCPKSVAATASASTAAIIWQGAHHVGNLCACFEAISGCRFPLSRHIMLQVWCSRRRRQDAASSSIARASGCTLTYQYIY